MTDKATHIELAYRIISTLNARMSQFVAPFDVSLNVNPLGWHELADENIRVIVFPAGIVEKRLGVDGGPNPLFESEATIHILLFRHCPPAEAVDNVTTMLRLVEQLYRTFYPGGLAMPKGRAVLMQVDNDPAYDIDRLRSDNLFVSNHIQTWRM
jgi:hypothetical protein